MIPIYIDTNNDIGRSNTFDLPPGRSVRSYDFTVPVDGALLAATGHLHDHGREVRIEDPETGEVLLKLESELDDAGRLLGVEQKVLRRFFGLLDARLPLEAGRRYRVVGEYFNPTGETIPLGGMAHVSGIFEPETMEGWSRVDPDSELYRRDVAALPDPLPGR